MKESESADFLFAECRKVTEMRKLYAVLLLLTVMSAASCAKSPSVNKETMVSSSAAPEEPRETEPPGFQEEYTTLVESYIEGTVFGPADDGRIKELSDLLKGHYDITGRTDGGNMEYYIAVRREDAPVYDDFSVVSVGELDSNLFIGYYDRESEPVVLYEPSGYTLLDMPLGYDSLDCFCFGIKGASDTVTNPDFHYAFDQNGRELLSFIKNKPGLSFYREGVPCVQFYYQDEDTLKFYSEPYSCYSAITEEEQSEIQRQLSLSQIVEGIQTWQEAWDYLNKKGDICSTGSALLIDGRRYEAYGNHGLTGYMMVTGEKEYDFISLIYNEDVYRLIMEKVKAVTGMDYADFDSQWFKTPLRCASIAFPEYGGINGAPVSEVRTQTVEDRDKLDALSTLMDHTLGSGKMYGFSACPYAATIDFIREDGETLRFYAATDSCDSMAYEGRISFEYGSQADLASIFDEAMMYRLAE